MIPRGTLKSPHDGIRTPAGERGTSRVTFGPKAAWASAFSPNEMSETLRE